MMLISARRLWLMRFHGVAFLLPGNLSLLRRSLFGGFTALLWRAACLLPCSLDSPLNLRHLLHV